MESRDQRLTLETQPNPVDLKLDELRATTTIEGRGNTLPAEIRMGDTVTVGQIYSFSSRYMRILLKGPVPLGTTIHVKFDGCVVQGPVEFCQKMFGGYRVGFELMDPGGAVYRREPRFPIEGTGLLSVLGAQGPKEARVQLADVSASGIGIYLEQQLLEQTSVYLRVAHSAIFGEVRYCQPAGERGFRLGIQSEIFVPETSDHVEDAPVIPPVRGILSLLGLSHRKK